MKFGIKKETFVILKIHFQVYIKIAHLDINPHPINFLDDLLLFICIPSFFMYCLFSAIPGLADGSSFTGNVITNTFMVRKHKSLIFRKTVLLYCTPFKIKTAISSKMKITTNVKIEILKNLG